MLTQIVVVSRKYLINVFYIFKISTLLRYNFKKMFNIYSFRMVLLRSPFIHAKNATDSEEINLGNSSGKQV